MTTDDAEPGAPTADEPPAGGISVADASTPGSDEPALPLAGPGATEAAAIAAVAAASSTVAPGAAPVDPVSPTVTPASAPTGAASTGPTASAASDTEVAAGAPAAADTTRIPSAGPDTVAASAAATSPAPAPLVDAPPEADPASPDTNALAWVDIERLAVSTAAGSSAMEAFAKGHGDLLQDAPRRSALRPAVLVPLAVLVCAAGAYTATTALWPLTALAPTVTATSVRIAPAPSAAVAWPATGSAAVGIEGMGAVASSETQVPMASITKVVTVLAALERMPLAPGEQGPSFSFTQSDSDQYWRYREQDQSSLDVPVGGSLTEYQLLQGILLGSANNYADRLAREIWGPDADFVAAAQAWLRKNDLTGISLENPSGFGMGNTATPRALLQLGQIAVHHPVIGEIIATPSAEIPGAGIVKNSNKLLGETGFIGVKTGTIGETGQEDFNLLSAKEITVDGTTVRIYASVLGQPDDEARYTASRSLYAEVEHALTDQAPAVRKGTLLGTVTTPWGEKADAVAAADARVALWNGATATATSAFSLGDDRKEGDRIGTLTVKGPVDAEDVAIELGSALHGPDLWWRMTHPLDLFGLNER